LIALALPAPVQRIADTRFGSLSMLVGVPAMIVFGLLNFKWQDGFPTISLDRDRAAELRRAANKGLNGLGNQAASENWGQSAVGFLQRAQGPNLTHAPSFPSTTPQAPNTAASSQQQLRYPQQQQYAGQYQQNGYQKQPQHLQQYSTQSTQAAPGFNQYPQPNPQWAGTSPFPGTNPANYGGSNYGTVSQPSGYLNDYPNGYPPQQPYPQQPYPQQPYSQQPYSQQPYPQQPYSQQQSNVSSTPSAGSGQTYYNQNGQLLRY